MWEFQILNQANQDKVGHPKLRSPYMAFALVYDSVTLERQPHALGKSHQPTFWLHTVPHQSCHLVSEVLTGHQPQLLPLHRGFTQSHPTHFMLQAWPWIHSFIHYSFLTASPKGALGRHQSTDGFFALYGISQIVNSLPMFKNPEILHKNMDFCFSWKI